MADLINRQPTEEELVLYLNHPGDALKTIAFQKEFGDPNHIPLDVWFEGLERKTELEFTDSFGKPHKMNILDISEPGKQGMSTIRYLLDSEVVTCQVKVSEAEMAAEGAVEMAQPGSPWHVASPSNGDLWVMYVKEGDHVRAGEELLNITIMKQEKSVHAPVDGIVKRVLKTANYKEDRKMVPVVEGELLVELALPAKICGSCRKPVTIEDAGFCPYCGTGMVTG